MNINNRQWCKCRWALMGQKERKEKTWRVKKDSIKLQVKSKLSHILPKKQSVFYCRTNYKLARLLPALCSQPTVEYLNVTHSRQVISPSSTPPLYSSTFARALQNWLERGQRSQEVGLGLYSTGGEGDIVGFSPFKKELLYSHLFNSGAMPGYKGKAKAQHTNRGISSGSTWIALTVFLARQQRKTKSEALKGQVHQQSVFRKKQGNLRAFWSQ